MRTEPATVRPVLRLEMLNSQCGRCSIYECAAQHPSHSIADSQWVQANTFSLQDTTHQKGLHYMHSTSNPANITGKTLSIWHAAGRGNKHNAARAKLHAALLPHAHFSSLLTRHTTKSFQHIQQTKPHCGCKNTSIAASTIYHSRGKTARGLFLFPSWCPLSSSPTFGEVDACQRAKRGVSMLRAHTSKGGVGLVLPGGDALS